MPYIRYKTGGKMVYRSGCRHCEIIDAYRAAAAAWLERRESGRSVQGRAAGTANSDVAYYQLTDAEYKVLHPKPLFRDFLLQMARDPDEALSAEDYADQDYDIDYSSF